MRILAFLLFFPLYAHAALEEWACNELADYYGYVAVDRDSGMNSQDRVNKTVKAIKGAMSFHPERIEIESADAQALIQIVYAVYLDRGTPFQIRRAAQMKCLGVKPVIRPAGVRI